MKGIVFKSLIGISFASIISTLAIASSTSQLSLEPLNEPAGQVTKAASYQLDYRLRNHGQEFKRLQLKPVAGMQQLTGEEGLCSAPVALKPGQSCILRLRLQSLEAVKQEAKAPLLCEPGTNFYDRDALSSAACLFAKQAPQIRLQEQPRSKASFAVTLRSLDKKVCFSSFGACTLSLFSFGQKGTVTITNTSDVALQNVSVILPQSWADVSASNCAEVPVRGSCTITFTTGSKKHPLQAIGIAGLNTNIIYTPIRVLGIGDPLDNGLIAYIKPGTGTGLIARTTDNPTMQNWGDLPFAGSTSTTDGFTNTETAYNAMNAFFANFAAKACFKTTDFTAVCPGAGNNCWYLPASAQMTGISSQVLASGYGIGIAGVYWSSTQVNAATARAFSSTIGLTTANKSDMNSVRCVRDFS